jgi:hypothetical protein
MPRSGADEVRKPRGRPFGPGNKPKGGSEKGSRRLPKLLKDMRLIVEKGLPADPTPLQQKLHTLFQSDIPKFLDRMTRLEQAHVATAAKGRADKTPGPETERDEGTERALAVLDAWLKERKWEQPDGPCPTCGRKGS